MRIKHVFAILVFAAAAVFVVACATQGEASGESGDADLRAKAAKLAKEFIIIDTHVDVPYRLQEKMEDISQPTEKGDFDYPRAKAGGLDAPFMSIYVPASYQKEPGKSKKLADELIDMVEKFQADWPDKFAIAKSPEQLREIFKKGLVALPLGMENGAAIEDDLANLKHFYDRGISYVTLTHSEANQICDSSYEAEGKWNGLSPFGRQVVAEMNRLGVMIDVSHISDQAFEQVMELSKAPAIASHSSCRSFTPGWQRNMSDEMIRKLAEKGGVIQINFGSSFLGSEFQRASETARKEVQAYLDEHGLKRDDPAAQEYIAQYRADHPRVYADISDVAAHIDHVVKLVGVDHVGFGSDFDGVGDSLPTGLKSVADYPNLIHELLKKGYSEEDIRKICGENTLRVWSEVRRVARELQK